MADKTAGIKEFLTKSLLDLTCVRGSDNYVVKSVTQYGFLIPSDIRLTEQELSDFQDRMSQELQDEFCISRRRAEVEVSWFIDRCGLYAKGR